MDTRVNAIRDGWARAIGIPAFGIAIPLLSGLYGDLSWTDPRVWAGQLAFVGLAAAIWQGNRWLLFKQREHWDWFAQPVRKLVLLLFAIVCFTAPLTVVWIAGWYSLAGFDAVDWDAVRTVTLANVICVVFVTHAYETVFLIRDRSSDLLRLSRLEQARTQAQLDALRAQIDPHFLFNSLNTLSWLIETDPPRAREFNETLARVYRYVLSHRERDLVDLSEELAFAEDYLDLMRLRFGDRLLVRGLPAQGQAPRARIVPISLQVVLENAIKHNRLSQREPLAIELRFSRGAAGTENRVEVRNCLRPRPSVRPTTRAGLRNLARRVELATGRPLSWGAEAGEFVASIPLLPAGPNASSDQGDVACAT